MADIYNEYLELDTEVLKSTVIELEDRLYTAKRILKMRDEYCC